MIKKTSVIAFLFLFFSAFTARSQQVGSWSIYQVFSQNGLQKVIDTDSKVFFLSDGWLYAYDKGNDETVYYNVINDLSDTGISDIYYNYDKKFLMLVYDNSNIDILRESGRVDNVPDLKNVTMTLSKAVNSVDFQGDYAYLATDFGYMVVDCDKCVTKESFNYGKKFNSMAATDKYIFASFDNCLYYSEIDVAHYEISSFKQTNYKEQSKICRTDNNHLFVYSGWLYGITIGDDPAQLSYEVINEASPSQITKSGDNYMASYQGKYMVVDAAGALVSTTELPAEIDGRFLSSYSGDGAVWNLCGDGLRQFRWDGTALTYLHEAIRPNAASVAEPYFMLYKNGAVYSMNSGSNYRGASTGTSFGLSVLKDGTWKEVDPKNVDFVNSNSRGSLSNPYGLTVDPGNSDNIWFGTWWEGIICVNKEGDVQQQFNNTNSPFFMNYICCVPDLFFDEDGNLWNTFVPFGESTYPQVFVLPAAKVYADNVTESDWTQISLGSSFNSGYGTKMLCLRRSGGRYVVYANNIWETNFVVLDTNGTPTDTSDDRRVVESSFFDQDGKSFEIGYIHYMMEDTDGKIWLGTDKGVGIVNRIENVFSGGLVVNRVKVARNDGTGLADYLLDGLSVSAISVDGAGRKWIGTTSSGLYLVSSDGSEIISHFTTENSSLTDDNILSVACSTDDNKVYVGTSKGIMVYQSDAMPSKSDYSEVYAYPNPVRPDYTGYITVSGLMDNSLVKIADSMGNVVYSGKSTGGMFVWDGCNSDGSRVNTGVYYVFASQNENDSSSGCVTKILVVR